MTDGEGSFVPAFSEFRLERHLSDPADKLSLSFPKRKWRGEARYLDIAAGQYENRFIIDRHSLYKDEEGYVQSIEARSRTGALLLDNGVYPRSYQNFSFEKIYKLVASAYGVEGYGEKENCTVPLFVIREGETAWEVLRNFARAAYNQPLYLLENRQLQIGKPKPGKSYVFSNTATVAYPYIGFQYETVPKARISHIRGLDEDGREKTISNSLAGGVVRMEYRRDPTDFSLYPKEGHVQRIFKSMSKSGRLHIQVPFFFPGIMGDIGALPEFSERPGGWQLESGIWSWRNGWTTELSFNIYQYGED